MPDKSAVPRVAHEIVAEERHGEGEPATLWPVEQALVLKARDQRLYPVVG